MHAHHERRSKLCCPYDKVTHQILATKPMIGQANMLLQNQQKLLNICHPKWLYYLLASSPCTSSASNVLIHTKVFQSPTQLHNSPTLPTNFINKWEDVQASSRILISIRSHSLLRVLPLTRRWPRARLLLKYVLHL